ncbi:hypothetical protein NADFUDRAFT_48442 [Nadsonia fulvescens var. elongata DSM 6958]|uniref:RNA polymerase II subunit B1 CTD phosphatase RPAP2 homolog n=1 Tax=Nadsonia fulvescens var. elongata DSM 6958 TaxID=857566 RepID=A0A1E3PS45_9ASCO|nr:hypothetical protein NADFUDRAFT_48442 [Nadsonia fulvescens var. elongata DSM 6958]
MSSVPNTGPTFATHFNGGQHAVDHPNFNDPSPTLAKFTSSLAPFQREGLLSAKECNQLILDLVELMADGVDLPFLKFASRFLTPQDYDEIIDERNIIHHCGYPVCNNDPKGVRQAHQINYRPNIGLVLPSTYLSKYCTKEHYQASVFYRSQLSDEALFQRRHVTVIPYGKSEWEQNVTLLEELQYGISQHKSLKQIVDEFKTLSMTEKPNDRNNSVSWPVSEDDVSSLGRKIEAINIQERINEVSENQTMPVFNRGDAGTRTIEGYTPSILN